MPHPDIIITSVASGLGERIRARIGGEGPIPFARFQEMALYDPEGGYYTRSGRIGRQGDFVTGASWHPGFARALARVALEIDAEVVVDVGCGEGQLLAALREALPAPVRVVGVDRVSRGASIPGVEVSSLEDLSPGLNGLLVGYELVDALPVSSVRMTGAGLVERRVGLDGSGGLAWVEAPAPPAVKEHLARFGVTLQPGQLAEVSLEANRLVRQLARRLGRGLLLLFDYGAPALALYSPLARPRGTLCSFRGHRVSREVLIEPGERDITAWVNFSDLEEACGEEGLEVFGLVSQARFLCAAGLADELGALGQSARELENKNALAKLVAPGGMGESIRVLVAGRGTPQGARFVAYPS